MCGHNRKFAATAVYMHILIARHNFPHRCAPIRAERRLFVCGLINVNVKRYVNMCKCANICPPECSNIGRCRRIAATFVI